MDVDPKVLVKRLGVEEDVTIRRALLMALGDYSIGILPQAERALIAPMVLGLYREDRDAGIHGAAEWVLRRWGLGEALARSDRILTRTEAEPGRDWYVSGLGHTMTVVRGPVESLMGSSPDEAGRGKSEDLLTKRIDRSFAIATKEVTVEQFQAFLMVKHLNPHPSMERYRVYNPEPECPVLFVSWYQAAAYCNWLSEQAGLPTGQWCYLPNREGEFADGMSCAPDYLKRVGYRLPTQAEWEYACRAGATTRFSFGESEGLIGHYAWFPGNSGGRTRPVGRLKPNDLGLFDMHGNLWERTQDARRAYPADGTGKAVEDQESSFVATDGEPRVVRGGAFDSHPQDLRSAFRFLVPMRGFFTCGFRPARTCPP
jgi:formylglycine-generating enzyme required for sulfatase activity